MNTEDMKSFKSIMISYQEKGLMLDVNETKLLCDIIQRGNLDNFSIMSAAMMLSTHIDTDADRMDKDFKCFNLCVNDPLKAANMMATGVVRNLDEFYERVYRYLNKKIREGGLV